LKEKYEKKNFDPSLGGFLFRRLGLGGKDIQVKAGGRMKLADLTLPISYDDARQYALVFTPALAARLAELHAIHGSPVCVPVPRMLTDGRLMLCADLLTEVQPGGLLAEMWAAADKAVLLTSVEVMPWAEALAMLPPEPDPTALVTGGD
jgi:hypothetical protein